MPGGIPDRGGRRARDSPQSDYRDQTGVTKMRSQRCQPFKVVDSEPAPQTGVYLRSPGGVNRGRRGKGWAAWAIPVVMIALGGAGCATVSPVPSTPTYAIAVRHDIEPAIVSEGRAGAFERFRRDFAESAKLGFNTIVARYLDESDWSETAEVARSNGMSLAGSNSKLEHFVLTGVLPNGGERAEALARGQRDGSPGAPTRFNLVLDSGRSGQQSERATATCVQHIARGDSCCTVGGSSVPPDVPVLAVVELGAVSDGPGFSMLEHWLAQYHCGLLEGRTGGLLVDRYRRVVGDPPGLVPADRPAGPSRLAAVRALVARAREWGSRIRGLAARPVAVTLSRGLNVKVAALVRGGRRCVLVYNPSPGQYARGEVLLPETINGAGLTRAVEVPAGEAKPAGNVYNPRRGRIALPVTLRPGDAALFELF